MAWGRKPSCTCGECRKCKHREYMRSYYNGKTPEERRRLFIETRDAERVRAYDRALHERRKDDPEYQRRRRAVGAVNNAIRDGRMKHGSCEVCGASAQAHHDDYDRPFNVRWLCSSHHADAHRSVA